jgi:hypothetical protein
MYDKIYIILREQHQKPSDLGQECLKSLPRFCFIPEGM